MENQNNNQINKNSSETGFNFLGGDSQNFLGKFIRFFVTLGLKILRLFGLKIFFEARVMLSGAVPIFYE